jgi:trehalose 6-phosphate phosphatase
LSGLSDVLLARLLELSQTPELLVALDFDGTLAPEVDVPDDARAIPAARAAVLRLLKAPHTRVALVSGRAMESLRLVTDLPDNVLLFGSHGVEARLDTPDTTLTLDDAELGMVEVLGLLLNDVAEKFDHVWIETKPAGFAVHTRLASADNARDAHEMALAVASAELEGLTVRRGKNVLEFSVRTTNKGDAVNRLRDYAGASAVFYAGDDVTDEDAFAALTGSDFGLKSGPGETVAEFRVPEPAEVAAVLDTLAEFRENAYQAPTL